MNTLNKLYYLGPQSTIYYLFFSSILLFSFTCSFDTDQDRKLSYQQSRKVYQTCQEL